jgi:hypothetical protein
VTFDTLQNAASPGDGQDLLNSLYQADIDYEFYELKGSKTTPQILFYCGGSWLPAESQKQLKQYIQSGGHLVCIGSYPAYDEYMVRMNLLEIPEPTGYIGNVPETLNLKIKFNQFGADILSSWMGYYENPPGEVIYAARSRGETLTAEEMEMITGLVEGDNYIIGYTNEFSSGRVTIIHASPSPSLLVAVLNIFQIPIPSRSLTNGIVTSLFRRDNNLYLFVINNSLEDKTAEIVMDKELLWTEKYQVEDLTTNKTFLFLRDQMDTFQVPVRKKDATLLFFLPED